MILAIETATDICSVAFKSEAGEVFEKRAESRGSHSEKLFLFIKALMEEQQFEMDDLKAVLVSEGPGSYTGLRIAASGVKGLLFDSDIPLCGVQTLASFAMAAYTKEPSATSVHAVIDARRKHLYHQQFVFSEGKMKAKTEARIMPIDSIAGMIQSQDTVVGTGINRLDVDQIKEAKQFGKDLISGRSLLQLFESDAEKKFIQEVDPQQFDPKYYTSNQV